MSEAWKQWEGQVVDAKFPLRQYAGGSEHSAVFVTERGEPAQKAAIKFIQVEEAESEAQLSRWKRAAQLSHPHVLRIFESGRCRLGEFDLHYVVMEYAEENLSQFLPQRPLTPAEARDVLAPTLEALAYLHGEGLAHGHLQPSNILAIEDRLKLSSDGISPVAEPSPEKSQDAPSQDSGAENPPVAAASATPRQTTPYDPPEAGATAPSFASDVWSLGMTLVEALTQRLPVMREASPSVRPQNPDLPETLPALFLDIARHCVERDPQRRWSVADIAARLNPAAAAPAPVAKAVAASAPATSAPAHVSPPPAAIGEPYKPPALTRPPLQTQTVAVRSSYTKPRYDLVQPHLKRPPLLPKFNHLGLWIAAALVVAALLVGPLLLSRRAPVQPVASAESAQPVAEKPAPPTARTKSQAKSAQKSATVASTASAPPTTQRTAQPPVAPPANKSKVSAAPAPAPAPAPAASTASLRNSSATPAPAATDATVKSSSNAVSKGEVLDQVMPEVSQKARATIRGTVRSTVKVRVDASGNVTGAELSSAGPSRYFADLALQAARRWDFAPAKLDGHAVPSEWLVRFEFTPSKTKAVPTQATP